MNPHLDPFVGRFYRIFKLLLLSIIFKHQKLLCLKYNTNV